MVKPPDKYIYISLSPSSATNVDVSVECASPDGADCVVGRITTSYMNLLRTLSWSCMLIPVAPMVSRMGLGTRSIYSAGWHVCHVHVNASDSCLRTFND